MRQKRLKQRSARGLGVIFGVVLVCGLLAITAVATVLLMMVGSGTVYDERLGRVGTYAAMYAAAHTQDGTTDAQIRAYTEQLMVTMGIKPDNVSIEIKKTNTSYGPSVQVTVANQFGLLGSRGTQVMLHDTVAAVIGAND